MFPLKPKLKLTAAQIAKVVTGKTDCHIHKFDDRHGMHNDVVPAWQQMVQAAGKDNITLALASSYRSFDRQLSIWNRKFTGELAILDKDEQVIEPSKLSELEKVHAIMLFSALPGASRHHWGTDIDVYAPNLLGEGQSLCLEQWEYQNGGPMQPLSLWLNEHAHKFGFFFPYDTYRGGVAAEPWHLSHGESAQQLQASLTLDCLYQQLAKADIAGKESILNNLESLYNNYIMNIGAYPNG